MRGKPGHHGEQRSLHRRQFWPKKKRHVNARRALGVPFASRPSATGGLLLCQHYGAFRLAGMSQIERHAICRIRLEKMENVLSEEAASQPPLQRVRSQNVGDLLQKVSSARLAFYLH